MTIGEMLESCRQDNERQLEYEVLKGKRRKVKRIWKQPLDTFWEYVIWGVNVSLNSACDETKWLMTKVKWIQKSKKKVYTQT